jgi:hypothetical protein
LEEVVVPMETLRSEHSSRSGRSTDRNNLARWKRDPVAFICEVLIDPETGQPFELYPAEERFLREGLKLTADGRLPFPEMVFSGPKKTGKTGLAAMIGIYTAVAIGGLARARIGGRGVHGLQSQKEILVFTNWFS